MSETIEYSGNFKGYKPEEKDELWKLISNFQQQVDEITENEKEIWFTIYDGWRGAGLSCQEIVKNYFEEYAKSHPHIEMVVWAKYVESPPCERFELKGDTFKNTFLG